MSERYHHGDLPNALRQAAIEVIDERGLHGFSLREVARRAGVSHAAPAHHFGDAQGLLTSLAQHGFAILGRVTDEAGQPYDDPVDRLAAIGAAYVELGQTHHAVCQVMFRPDVIDESNPDLMNECMSAYGVLENAVRSLIDDESLDVDLNDAVWLCWSTMQGLVALSPQISGISELKSGTPVETPELVRRFTKLMVNGLRGADQSR
jgi:AcrR family transcriptional regulator